MIRKLKISDKKQYLALLEQLTTVGEICDDKWETIFNKIDQNPLIEIYVLIALNNQENEDIILGAGTLLLEPKFIHAGSIVGHIEDIVVAEKARGLGLGKEVVDFLITRARELGAYKVILDTKEETTGFYAKLGFKKHEVQMRLNL